MNTKIKNAKKIQGTSVAVLPQASLWPMVRDCISWTASRPPMRRAVALAVHSFAPSVAVVEAAIGLYHAHEC